MLYPYRANDAKNRVRWQFGVLAPPAFAAADPSERDLPADRCLLEGHDVTVSVHVRFLHVQRRTRAARNGRRVSPTSSRSTSAMPATCPWDEAVVCTKASRRSRCPGFGARRTAPTSSASAGDETELLPRRWRRRSAGWFANACALDAAVIDRGRGAARPLRRATAAAAAGEPHALDAERHRHRDPNGPTRCATRWSPRTCSIESQRRRVRLAHRHPGMGARIRERVRADRRVPGAGRAARRSPPRPRLADHPVRPPAGRARRVRRSSATAPRWTRCSRCARSR